VIESADDDDYLDEGEINYERLKAATRTLNRPLDSLYALSRNNDPYAAGMDGRRAWAEWFAKVWRDLKFAPGTHVRHVHYKLVSTTAPILTPGGAAYRNTFLLWQNLKAGARDARYLGLIPEGSIIDRRNPEPLIYLPNIEETPAVIGAQSGGVTGVAGELSEPELDLPILTLDRPVIRQRYHVEIWCEKTTQNDILMAIGQSRGVNIITGPGDQSATRCEDVIKRAIESGLPLRILYVSDFDPQGENMPVAVARKLEFAIRNLAREKGVQLDVQVRAVALTYEQTKKYKLPRTPLKETEHRAEGWEERYGEGATELDALEALHPGELRRILLKEIDRYYDRGLASRTGKVAAKVERDLTKINDEVHANHEKEINEVEEQRERIAEEIKDMRERVEELESELQDAAAPVIEAIEAELEAGTGRE
jgi:hypothetical protein